MRRSIPAVLALLFAAALLSGCGRGGRAGADGRLVVVATIFPPYDFVREIAGDSVDLTLLLPPGAESHTFEPTPQDIARIRDCDLFIYVGGESDEWIRGILASTATESMTALALMDLVEAVPEELVEGMEAGTHGHEDDHGHEAEYDEHVWTSPKNAKLIVAAIAEALCEAGGANAPQYRQRAASYLEKLDELDLAFQAAVDAGVRRTLVFGDRFPFRYLADAYGLRYFAAFPGCSSESEPSAATVTFLIDKVKAEEIPVVFHLELSNEKMADTICEETGAEKRLLHACHNISKSDFENGVDYLELMTANVAAIREALG